MKLLLFYSIYVGYFESVLQVFLRSAWSKKMEQQWLLCIHDCQSRHDEVGFDQQAWMIIFWTHPLDNFHLTHLMILRKVKRRWFPPLLSFLQRMFDGVVTCMVCGSHSVYKWRH